MTIVKAASTLTAESSTVKLAQYAQAIQVCECAMWGVSNSGCDTQGCRDIWVKSQRDEIAYYLAEAQEELEREIGYHIGYKWDTNERHQYGRPVKTVWGYVVAGGTRATSIISAGEAVDHTADPAIIGPVATTVTDENEIHVYHPGSDVEIDPSSITIAGGFATIEVPRCRMVLESLADNTTSGVSYTNIANFESTVDVYRVYNDTTTPATLVKPGCSGDCSETTADKCIYVRYSKLGSVDVPNSNLCACSPAFVDLNYYSGVEMTRQMQDTIIRLAHSKMPRNPCSCSPIDEFWKRDRNVPAVLTAERLNCPFGLSDGAWIAWEWAKAMRLVRGSVL